MIGVHPGLRFDWGGFHRASSYPFARADLRWTHLGRGAVALALRGVGLAPGQRLAMPAYHCGSEVQAAHLLGLSIEFYRVRTSLEVDAEDMARVADRCDGVYLIAPLGFPPPRITTSKPIIVDAAQALFSEGVAHGAHAIVFSPRKTLGLPEGGAVIIPSASGDAATAPYGPARSRTLHATASLVAARMASSRVTPVARLMSQVLTRHSQTDAAIRAGTATETIFPESGYDAAALADASVPPSAVTRWLARRCDGAAIREARRRHYVHLLAELGDRCPERYRTLFPGVCPLYFPIAVADRKRAMMRLLDHGVRAAEIWPVAHPLLPAALATELAAPRRELVALPVHQGLRPSQLATIVRAAKAALR